MIINQFITHNFYSLSFVILNRPKFISGRNLLDTLISKLDGSIELMSNSIASSLLPEKTIASYTRQIVYGLSYLHEQSIVHRTLKPDNIIVFGHNESRLKIVDLESAIFYEAGRTDQTATAMILKSERYTPPEGFTILDSKPEKGNRFLHVIVPRSFDVWSFGCIVLDMFFPHNLRFFKPTIQEDDDASNFETNVSDAEVHNR